MLKTEYHIPKMDCPSEENLIRLKLDGIGEIHKLAFDLEARRLEVFHEGDPSGITKQLKELNLGSSHVRTIETADEPPQTATEVRPALLWTVLAINFGFFAIESVTGWISRSMGLVADSLDMLADALVYGLALWAIGSTVRRKKSVALFSGIIQLILALLGVFEVIRRFLMTEALPDYRTMIGISILALMANSVCLYLLQRAKSEEAHIKATVIFTSNDVIINSGVIIAGILVLVTRSGYPDLIVGGIVFLIVLRGALRMIRLGK
jgi:Co/Zn/Cd efflux system component